MLVTVDVDHTTVSVYNSGYNWLALNHSLYGGTGARVLLYFEGITAVDDMIAKLQLLKDNFVMHNVVPEVSENA